MISLVTLHAVGSRSSRRAGYRSTDTALSQARSGSGAAGTLGVMALAIFSAVLAQGQTINWIGGTSTSWFNDANWSSGSKPNSGNTVWIYYSTAPQPTRYCVVDGDASTTGVVANIYIGQAGTTLNRLDVTGVLKVGTLIQTDGSSKLNVQATGVLLTPSLYFGGYGSVSSATALQSGTLAISADMQIGNGNNSSGYNSIL